MRRPLLGIMLSYFYRDHSPNRRQALTINCLICFIRVFFPFAGLMSDNVDSDLDGVDGEVDVDGVDVDGAASIQQAELPATASPECPAVASPECPAVASTCLVGYEPSRPRKRKCEEWEHFLVLKTNGDGGAKVVKCRLLFLFWCSTVCFFVFTGTAVGLGPPMLRG